MAKHKSLLLVLLLSSWVPLFILFVSGDHGQRGFPLDDAWIHLVYGRSVAERGYLAYNEGIPSTGSTSPLWGYTLGIIHFLLQKENLVIWGGKFLGVLLHAIMAYLSFRIVIRFTQSEWAGLFSGLLVGLCPPLAISSISGMEISLGCALCLAGAYSYCQRRWSLSGLLLGLSGLTRPEFAAPIALLLLDMSIQVLKKKLPWVKLLAFLFPIAALATLNLSWNLGVDGRPFPATFYVKAWPRASIGLAERLIVGSYMILKHTSLVGGLIGLGLLCLFFLKTREKKISLIFYAMGFGYLSGSLVMIPPNDPEAFYYIRYLLPSVPLLFLGTVIALTFAYKTLWEKIQGSKAVSRGIQALVFRAGAGLMIILVCVLTNSGLYFWAIKYSRDCRNINEVQVALGQAISRAFRDDMKIGTVDAGAIRYFGNRKTFDLIGLNTKNIFDCQKDQDQLDALVLMPAWVSPPPRHNLEVILTKRTQDYQVTSNPLMDRQFIAVCRSESNQLTQDLDIPILSRFIKVCLKCLTATEIEALKASMRQ